jgi:HlyD family secretion protein
MLSNRQPRVLTDHRMDIQRPNVEKRRNRRYLIGSAAAVVFVGLFATAWSLGTRPPAIDRDDIWTGEVRRGELVHEISATGTLVAVELRAVTNRSEGVVEEIHVLPGHVVGPDDVLIQMSSPTLEDELVDARWELAAAEAEDKLSQMEAENRYVDLVADVARADADYESSRLELEALEELDEAQLDIERARLRTAQLRKSQEAEHARLDGYEAFRDAQAAAGLAHLSQLREKVARLEARVDDLAVRAGGHGVVQEVNVEEGQRLQAGEAVARIVNPDRLIARIGVAERDAASVQIGLPVRLEIGRNVIRGSVTRIDPTVRDRLVTIDVALEDAEDAPIRPDLSVTARIELQRIADALVLARPVGLRDAYETVELFRLERGGSRARRVEVEIGRASAREVEIVSGLEAGDEVVLADLSDWADVPMLRIR